MNASRFLLRRAIFALLLVFVVSSSAFILTRLAPGDVSDDWDPVIRAQLRAQLGFERPLGAQYAEWIAHIVRFDFGRSVVFSRPVADLLAERALNTAVLALVALVGATLVGIPAGVYTGSSRNRTLSSVVRAISIVVLSVPPLLASLLLVLIAARTGWFPLGGMTSLSAGASYGAWLRDLSEHVPLPALALALPLAATLERLQSQSIAEAVDEPFVRAALARGTTWRSAVNRHAWPVSLGPVLGLYGLVIGSLFSGSFVVEVVTSWPGLGRLMYDALRGRDLYLVAGCAAAGAVFIATGTLLADVLLAATDPRRRVEAQA